MNVLDRKRPTSVCSENSNLLVLLFLLTLIAFTNKVVCVTLLSYNDRICFLMYFTSYSFQYLYLGSRDNQECLLCKRSYH